MPTSAAATSAYSTPATIAIDTSTCVRTIVIAATYPAPPQNSACPNESRPTYPNSRSSETANSPKQTRSIATTGYSTSGSTTPAISSTIADDRGAVRAEPADQRLVSARPKRPAGRSTMTSTITMKISVVEIGG